MRRLVFLWALCATIVGCSKAEDGTEDQKIGTYSLFDPVASNPALCGAPAIPFPNNALFADATNLTTGLTTDATLNIPSAASTAVAANLTDGFSTTASIFTDVLGFVDYTTTANSVVIVEADATPRILVPGVDYAIQPSIAMAQLSGTGGACAANPLPARFLPISQQRSRILIEPLKPLNPSTTYIVAVTKGLLSTDGVPTIPSEWFTIANSDTKICRLTGGEAGSELLCSDTAAPAAAAAIHPVLATLNATQLTTIESLRRNLVRPTVTGFKSLQSALADPDLTDDDLVIAWSFTTESTTATLATLNAIATAKTFTVVNSGLSTGALGLADTANIWVGTFNGVPYYLDDASGPNDFASQLAYWHNNGAMTSTANGGFVPFTPPADYDGAGPLPVTPSPCSGAPFNFVAPVSTTNCYRIPVANGNDAQGNPWGSLENLPVVITVPKTAKPTNGWPVVIFQHGITGHRGQMLPLGATLAGAGFVTVAIDLPLHGILAGDPTFGALRQAGNERTFDLDISSNTSGACLSAPAGDGAVDASGTCFINLGSLATTRDNLRQAVADLIHLSKSLGDSGLNFDGSAGNDIDLTTPIRFAGISLGSIVGTTLLGVDTGANPALDEADERIGPASLSVPGGGLAKLLDASASFGPRIAVGLAGGALSPAPNGVSGASSPYEGTDTYETFVRFAQHLTDPGDPINFAVAANANHRIHMSEVIGDTVVPNTAYTTCPAPDTLAPGIGATATSNATNAETRLAACTAGGLLVGGGSNATMAALCPGIATTGLCPGTASQDETLISGYLSGTEPLYGLMGLDVEGPLTPPTTATSEDCSGLDVVVRFAIGTHGSLLSPAGPGGATQFLAVTTEMQRQTATYLFSNGTTLVSGGCP